MENYIVSARKYRPATFASVVGQKALTGTLKNAIAADRLAHAYLFCGSRGVGKTSCARIFAKTINCTHRTPDGEACNECESCRLFNEGRSLNIVELDAASHNGIDDIKNLIDQVQIPPTTGRYRVFIIDEVHMLTAAAFNAFLKTLEEPPAYVIFILATTEKHKIIPTILSRCQIYDFSRITIEDMVSHLQYVAAQEGMTAEESALHVIARKADGAMRDALSIFDQVAAASRGNITYHSAIDNLNVLDQTYYGRLVNCFMKNDVPGALLIYKEIRDRGFDSLFFITGLGQYLRDLTVASDPSTLVLLEASDDIRKAMAAQAAKLTPQFLYRALALCNDTDLNYRQSSNKQLLVELTLIKLCQPESSSLDDAGSEELEPLTAPQGPVPAHNASESAHNANNITPEPAPALAPESTVHAPVHPQVMQQPTAARTPAERPHAAPTGRGLRAPGLSLRQDRNNSKPEAATATQQHNTTLAPTPLEETIIKDLRNNFIHSHQEHKLLVNVMRSAIISAATPTVMEIKVANSTQADILRFNSQLLENWLRSTLNNHLITVRVMISAEAETPDALTDRELLAKMCEQHKDLKNFMDEFQLRME
ncbi:MAG: DNA polymerase III subunit gamma/tau [Muribaculaceae bacterium]|nr:DNA polymerase III subunit gamma/tau [Muribaculaceae bacterium]